ncbi:hypothetical protein [Spartinivicinus poritis]|uniref:Uncharacterized protein n=1 Tax=Spartinivicinus poritis TaxID=2994640 RepID=A0ABT5U3L0_9GAMM|nr:hypothetical protein [Spartinivicinus sp. A2-2]MDE1460957.1 hypothetical protein [Spartinivicinus sp. A2-2]
MKYNLVAHEQNKVTTVPMLTHTPLATAEQQNSNQVDIQLQ